MSSEMEGSMTGTFTPYGAIVRRGAGGMRYASGGVPHVGDEVAVAGEPGMRAYRVAAVCPERDRVQIWDRASGGAWWMSPAALEPTGTGRRG